MTGWGEASPSTKPIWPASVIRKYQSGLSHGTQRPKAVHQALQWHSFPCQNSCDVPPFCRSAGFWKDKEAKP